MSGIEREILLDRRHIAKHLSGTPQSERLLQRGRAAHMFNDEATLPAASSPSYHRGWHIHRLCQRLSSLRTAIL